MMSVGIVRMFGLNVFIRPEDLCIYNPQLDCDTEKTIKGKGDGWRFGLLFFSFICFFSESEHNLHLRDGEKMGMGCCCGSFFGLILIAREARSFRLGKGVERVGGCCGFYVLLKRITNNMTTYKILLIVVCL